MIQKSSDLKTTCKSLDTLSKVNQIFFVTPALLKINKHAYPNSEDEYF